MPADRSVRLLLLTVSCVALGAETARAQIGAWSQSTFATSPGNREQAVMVYDAARSVLVLFGGESPTAGSLRDTWECNGSAWTLRNNQNPRPPSGTAMAAAFDVQRARTVLVWCDAGSSTTQTWEWDGVAWQQRSSSGPPGRYGFALAYDSQRGRTVMFGGRSGNLGDASDTWEWDGSTWLQRGSGGPPARHGHAMCYDAQRGVVVLHGGRADNPNATYADTWEWNGAYWLERFGVNGPSFRFQHGMAFDAAAGRSVLFGGWSNTGSGGPFQETWEWDGTQWLLRSLANRPAARFGAPMAYDAARQCVTLFGGNAGVNGIVFNDTWRYAILSGNAASFAAFGSGCPGPLGVPALGAVGGSLPRLGSTLQLQLSGLPFSPFNVPFGVIGSSNTVWNGVPLPIPLDVLGFTGCQAWIAPEASYTLGNVSGTATWSIGIPFAPLLLSADFYVQGAVLALGWNPGGMVFSNAGHGTVGLP